MAGTGGRVVLVTGGCGFIGSAVVCHLHRRHPQDTLLVLDRLDPSASRRNLPPSTAVIRDAPERAAQYAPDACVSTGWPLPSSTAEASGLVLPPATVSPGAQSELAAPTVAPSTSRTQGEHGLPRDPVGPGVHLVVGDVCDLGLVEALLRTQRVGTVLHFAAQTHVDNSFELGLAFTYSNVLGTHVMLEAARRCKEQLKLFVHVSTDEVYGETPPGVSSEFREHQSPLEPTNPYAASKAAAEMLVKAYARSYGLPLIVTRGNNVYGPRQYPEKLVPKFILRALSGDMLPIHGDGTQQRGFVYVDDVATAFDTILDRGVIGSVYNIGTPEELTVLEVASDICRLTERTIEDTVRHVEDRKFQDRRYLMDNSKLAELDWAPGWTWKDGLAATVAWYREHPDYWQHERAALAEHASLLRS